MRIKKIENVIGLVGHVLKQSTKSDVNTYSANYLNDRIVKVSTTEPTTGEKVWIQHSKNILNPLRNMEDWGKYTFNNGVYTLTSSDETTILLIATVKVGKAYVLSYKNKNGFEKVTVQDYNHGGSWQTYASSTNTSGSINFVATSETALILFNKGSVGSTIEEVQLEQGETATSYEPYVDKKIYTKNDNGSYNEFYNESGIIESGSNDNGDWIKFADGTMIVTQTYSKFQDCVDTFGSFYSTAETILPDFPVTFKEKPRIIKSTTTADCLIISGAANTSVSSPGSVKFLEINKVQKTYTACVIARGKWK